MLVYANFRDICKFPQKWPIYAKYADLKKLKYLAQIGGKRFKTIK